MFRYLESGNFWAGGEFRLFSGCWYDARHFVMWTILYGGDPVFVYPLILVRLFLCCTFNTLRCSRYFLKVFMCLCRCFVSILLTYMQISYWLKANCTGYDSNLVGGDSLIGYGIRDSCGGGGKHFEFEFLIYSSILLRIFLSIFSSRRLVL